MSSWCHRDVGFFPTVAYISQYILQISCSVQPFSNQATDSNWIGCASGVFKLFLLLPFSFPSLLFKFFSFLYLPSLVLCRLGLASLAGPGLAWLGRGQGRTLTQPACKPSAQTLFPFRFCLALYPLFFYARSSLLLSCLCFSSLVFLIIVLTSLPFFCSLSAASAKKRGQPACKPYPQTLCLSRFFPALLSFYLFCPLPSLLVFVILLLHQP